MPPKSILIQACPSYSHTTGANSMDWGRKRWRGVSRHGVGPVGAVGHT